MMQSIVARLSAQPTSATAAEIVGHDLASTSSEPRNECPTIFPRADMKQGKSDAQNDADLARWPGEWTHDVGVES